MIYNFPEQSEAIRQGDIFKSLPYIMYNPDKLNKLDVDKGAFEQDSNWTEHTHDEEITILATLRPSFGIVVTQDCDTERDDYIAFFKIEKFSEIIKDTPNAKNPLKWWADILTLKARSADKWFYLPPDNNVGFTEKMIADFQTVMPIPSVFLRNNLNLRIGRLNDLADEHFREKIAHYFRRYPYDEWYPLSPDEFAEYIKNATRANSKPFPWQTKIDETSNSEE